MKKKLEAELISIAHRILKLKNRAELDQLQQETLKLYEKLSVLKFIEDHYGGAEPTIGRASALGTLEEVYGIEEVAPVHANEVEEKEDEARAKKAGGQNAKEEEAKEAPVAEGEENEPAEEAKTNAQKEEETAKAASAPEAEETVAEEKEEEAPVADGEESEVTEAVAAEEPKSEIEKPELPKVAQPEHQEPEEEPEVKIQVEKPEEDVKAEEASAKAVFEKEIDATAEEEEKAADAEMQTIAPNTETKVELSQAGFEFAYERKPAPDEPKKKEISFEDFHDYKEPEFVKKSPPAPKAGEEASGTKGEPAPVTKNEEPKQPEPVRDWRDWEPSTSPYGQKKEEPKPSAAKPLNIALGNAITLGLNDRIAFEKHLFGGSADDLNRVISQLNTLNSFEEAQNFINDLVKPDYNNWANKEEYEERFMAIVEKRFG